VRDSGSEEHWRQVVASWRRSGLSIRAFCARHGLSEPTYYLRRREIDRHDLLKTQFLPVRVIRGETASDSGAGVEIAAANGRCLRVRPGFDRSTFVQVLDPLE
jgi:hypothetical protein